MSYPFYWVRLIGIAVFCFLLCVVNQTLYIHLPFSIFLKTKKKTKSSNGREKRSQFCWPYQNSELRETIDGEKNPYREVVTFMYSLYSIFLFFYL